MIVIMDMSFLSDCLRKSFLIHFFVWVPSEFFWGLLPCADMTRFVLSRPKKMLVLSESVRILLDIITLLMHLFIEFTQHYEKYTIKSRSLRCSLSRSKHLYKLVYESDLACKEQLRMDRRTFAKLCQT